MFCPAESTETKAIHVVSHPATKIGASIGSGVRLLSRHRHLVNNSLARSKTEPVEVPKAFSAAGDRYGQQAHEVAHAGLLTSYALSEDEAHGVRNRTINRYIAQYPDQGRQLLSDLHLTYGDRILADEMKAISAFSSTLETSHADRPDLDFNLRSASSWLRDTAELDSRVLKTAKPSDRLSPNLTLTLTPPHANLTPDPQTLSLTHDRYDAAQRANPTNVTYAKGHAAAAVLSGDLHTAIRSSHHAAELATMPRFREPVCIGVGR